MKVYSMASLLVTSVIQIVITAVVIRGAFVEKHGHISGHYFTEYSMFRRQVPSLSSCAMYCYYAMECVSFFYNDKEFWCQGHSVLFTIVPQSRVTSPGTNYYSIYEDWCSMPGYLNHRGLDLCYRLYNNTGQPTVSFSYQDGVDFCTGRSEELISHLNILQLVQVTHQFNTTDYQFVWIDGTDEGTEGIWYFSNGDPITNSLIKI